MHQVRAMQETKVILEHPPTGIQLHIWGWPFLLKVRNIGNGWQPK